MSVFNPLFKIIQGMMDKGTKFNDLILVVPDPLPYEHESIQTPWGRIQVQVVPYVPKDQWFIVDKKAGEKFADSSVRPKRELRRRKGR